MAQIVSPSNSSRILEIDANGKALVKTSDSDSSVKVFFENDSGAVTGTPSTRSPEVSGDFRLRVGVDTMIDSELFQYSAQNSSKHKIYNNTLTAAYSGGFLTTNGSSATSTGGVLLQTYRNFYLQATAPLYCETSLSFTNWAVSNTTIDFGLFTAGTLNPYTPTDGVYFRVTSAGLFGVTNFNGVEQTSSVFSFTPVNNTVYKYNITVNEDEIEFWVNDNLMGKLPKPIGQGFSFMQGGLPFSLRHAIVGSNASAAMSAKFAYYFVTTGDLMTNRRYSETLAGQGMSLIQAPSGVTQGGTSNNINSAAPASGTLSNTAAGFTSLGGQFQFAAVAGAETDYALFAYLNPTASATIQGKNMVISGIWIDTINTGAAVAGTATVLQWTASQGCTTLSMATTEAANTRATRRVSLGFQSLPIGAAIGAQAQRIDVKFDTPLVIEPGTYFHLILKMPIGTATASQVIRGVVGINGYWE